MSVTLLELAATALGNLKDRVTFVGAATMGLWISDPAAPEVIPTRDVDVVVEVATRTELIGFEEQLRSAGFRDEGRTIGRWLHGQDLILDVLPSGEKLESMLGFDNLWQRESIPHAARITLPSGSTINVITPNYLVATKLEAFRVRGNSDFAGSRDFGDIIALFDGRVELVDEVRSSPEDLRIFLVQGLSALFSHPRSREGIQMHLNPDEASQARGSSVVIPRIEAIVGDQ